MLNNKACGTCQHFDPVLRGTNRGSVKETVWGWCAKKSVYPYAPGPGQIFPEGVKRVENPGDPAKPKVVRRLEVVSNCNDFQARRLTPTKPALINKLNQQIKSK